MQALNISEKNKVILWMPQSTASRLATLIFNNFDFSSYNGRKGGVFLGNTIEHNHYIGLPINHKDYKLILTCRNPYTQATAGFDGTDSIVIKVYLLLNYFFTCFFTCILHYF